LTGFLWTGTVPWTNVRTKIIFIIITAAAFAAEAANAETAGANTATGTFAAFAAVATSPEGSTTSSIPLQPGHYVIQEFIIVVFQSCDMHGHEEGHRQDKKLEDHHD